MNNKNKKNKGFSLIELLIAVTILSIVMIMVTQFMGTSSLSMMKVEKNMNIQTEAMEVGSKISDYLVQATYIRVDSDRTYDLVVDNYPNFQGNAVERKVVLDSSSYEFLNENDLTQAYPNVRSFRILGEDGSDSLEYVKPELIYLQYKEKNEICSADDPTSKTAYVIFEFVDNEIYMWKGSVPTNATNDYYAQAKSEFDQHKELLTEHVLEPSFSADADANTVFLNILFEDPKFEGYNYHYSETVMLRNSNVLTVEPNKLFKKNVTAQANPTE